MGPISSAPVTVHIERLIERPTVPLCGEETQAHTNRFPVDRQEGVWGGIAASRGGQKRWMHLRGPPPQPLHTHFDA